MTVLAAALVATVLAGCGRLGFDRGSPGDADPRDVLEGPDAAAPCGAFGTVKAEHAVAAGTLIDIDRIAVTPTTVLVATNTNTSTSNLYTLDHDLAPLRGPTPIQPAGNMGISYAPTRNWLFGYQNSTVNTQITTFTPSGIMIAGPTSTNLTTGSGFVDDLGNLHLPLLTTAGFREYDSAHTPISTWGMDVPGPGAFDAAYDPSTQTAWHVATTGTITPYDLRIVNRPAGTSFVIERASGLQIDVRGALYVLSRVDRRIYVVKPAPTVVDMITFVDDPAAMAYDPVTDRLLVGFFTPAVVRQLCPYLP